MSDFGLPDKTRRIIRQILADFPAVEKAILYGSRAKGNYKPGSDIDLTLVGDELDQRMLGQIAARLDESPIPYQVDLSLFCRIDHAQLREHIERVGVVFYERERVAKSKGAGVMAGWQTKTLGEVCRFIDYRGKTPEKTDSGLRFITAKNVKMGYVQESPMEFVAPETYDAWMTRGIPKVGDVLFTTEAPLANVAQLDTDEKVVFAQRIIILQPKHASLDGTYLKYYLLSDSAQELIHAKGTGATVKGIKASLLKTVPVSYPPLPEQKRIVGILDEAFDSIATAKANAEKNLQNARALFESHLQAVFSQRGEGWEEKPLLSFAHSVSTGPFGSLLHKSDYVSDGVPLVNPINIVNGAIIPDGDKMIDPATKQRLQSYVLQKGDIVVGRRGEIGRCAVVEAEQAGWVCGTGCFFIRPLHSVNPYFLANLIRSSSYREQLESASSGATMLNLSNKALGELPVAIPKLLDQNHILAQLDTLGKETQRLESIYQRKLSALDALKKSLMDQAFTGQL